MLNHHAKAPLKLCLVVIEMLTTFKYLYLGNLTFKGIRIILVKKCHKLLCKSKNSFSLKNSNPNNEIIYLTQLILNASQTAAQSDYRNNAKTDNWLLFAGQKTSSNAEHLHSAWSNTTVTQNGCAHTSLSSHVIYMYKFGIEIVINPEENRRIKVNIYRGISNGKSSFSVGFPDQMGYIW